MGLREDDEGCRIAAELLKALAHPIRLRIIAILCDQEEHVGGLASHLGQNQAVVSQQLRVLRMGDLVRVRRQDGFAYYRLAEPRLKRIVKCLQMCARDRIP